MYFGVSSQEKNGFFKVILEDRTAGSKVVIHPEHGALLHAFEIQTDEGPLNIIDNYPTPESLTADLTRSFKSCKLSPFACRIPGGRYTHENHSYQLQNLSADGSSVHGLLYNRAFKVVDEFYDENLASVQLKYNYRKEDGGYPFYYRCEVTYTLLPGNLLQVKTTIINLSDTAIPLADGWHPYFKLGGTTDDWTLQFNASSMLEFNEDLVPTGSVITNLDYLEEKSLEGASLDNCFILDTDGSGVACILSNPVKKISISFFPDETYPYLQIYIPPGKTSIAIENLSGVPNCFNNNIGLLQLQPGHSKTFTVQYKTNKQ